LDVVEEELPLLVRWGQRGWDVLALEPGRIGVHDQEEREPEGAVDLTRARHDQDRVRFLDARDEGLLAAEDPSTVVTPSRRRQVVRVRSGVGLGDSERDLGGAAGDASEPALLL